ncbi:MAG TPA: MarR family winged helix-turn-helix transcriptional regulator [Gaiellaceae bacterium]
MAATSELAPEALAAELVHVLAGLRRMLRRRTQTAVGPPGLSSAEAELLRLVGRQPGLRVGEAAATLRLAPNTVSTVVRRLTSLGLLDAGREPDDRRAVSLRLSADGSRRVARWRDERTQLLAASLEGLSTSDRRTLTRALPVLTRVVELLEHERPT